MKLMQSV